MRSRRTGKYLVLSSAGTDRAQRGHNQNTIGPFVLTSTPDFLLTRLLFGVALSLSAPSLSLCVPSSSLFALFVNSVCVAVLRVLYSALLDRLSVISEAAVSSALHSAFPVLLFILYSMPNAFTGIKKICAVFLSLQMPKNGTPRSNYGNISRGKKPAKSIS